MSRGRNARSSPNDAARGRACLLPQLTRLLDETKQLIIKQYEKEDLPYRSLLGKAVNLFKASIAEEYNEYVSRFDASTVVVNGGLCSPPSPASNGGSSPSSKMPSSPLPTEAERHQIAREFTEYLWNWLKDSSFLSEDGELTKWLKKYEEFTKNEIDRKMVAKIRDSLKVCADRVNAQRKSPDGEMALEAIGVGPSGGDRIVFKFERLLFDILDTSASEQLGARVLKSEWGEYWGWRAHVAKPFFWLAGVFKGSVWTNFKNNVFNFHIRQWTAEEWCAFRKRMADEFLNEITATSLLEARKVQIKEYFEQARTCHPVPYPREVASACLVQLPKSRRTSPLRPLLQTSPVVSSLVA